MQVVVQNASEEVYAMKARLKFTKAGTMKFIGHLDVMRYFQKAFRRCGIDISYSQGFNPHQLISFASPLGVGLTSDGEYLDMQLESCKSSNEMIDTINRVMNDEFQIVEFVQLPDKSKTAMSIVAAADYRISLKDGYTICEDFKEKFQEFMEQEKIVITKKTKKSTTEMDMKPFIYHYAFSKEEFEKKTNHNISNSVAEQYHNDNVLFIQVSAGSVVNIKPNQVLEAFYAFMEKEMEPFSHQYHRLEMYADLAKEGEAPQFVTLGSFGTILK